MTGMGRQVLVDMGRDGDNVVVGVGGGSSPTCCAVCTYMINN